MLMQDHTEIDEILDTRSDRIEEIRDFCEEAGYVGYIPPRVIPYRWHEIAPLLIAGSRAWEEHYSLRDIYNYLIMGAMQLWIATQYGAPYLAAVTEISQTPKHRIFEIKWLGGTKLVGNGIKFLEYFKYIASKNKCTRLEINGRAGFEKLLGPEFQRRETMFSAEINPYMEN